MGALNSMSFFESQNTDFAKAAPDYLDTGWYVQTKNKQEIYMPIIALAKEKLISDSIIIRSARLDVNDDNVYTDDDGYASNGRVFFEMIDGTLDADLTWDTRPSDSAGTTLQTLYWHDQPYSGTSGFYIGAVRWAFTTYDTAIINKIVNGQAYLRLRPDPTYTANNRFRVVNNYSSISFDVKSGAESTDVGTKTMTFNVFDVTRTQLNCDETVKWPCRYICTGGNAKAASKIVVECSVDDGEKWIKVREASVSTAQQWRDSGYLIVPADTIPVSEKTIIKISLYNASNESRYWQRTYKTVSAKPKVKILTPVQVYVEGTEPLIMRWQYEGAYTQARYTVQYTLDAPTSTTRTWYTLASTTSSAATYTIPANSLPGGNVWLSVTVQDTQGKTAMDASSIVVSATPRVTNIRITPNTSAPRITVSWDCSDQEAAQVRIDNGTTYDSGILFGKDKTHTPDVWLSNGSHTVSVRAQNRLGFWSPWANVTISTSNSGGAAITLNAVTVGQSINLSWATTGNYSQYIVMRDGVKIGTTKAKAYSDYYTAGTHTYRVRGLMTYTYTDSNNASATLYTAKAQIAAIVDSGVPTWIQLWLGTDPERTVNRSVAQTVAYTHYSGRDWPVAEVSEYRDETYSVTVALTNAADQKNFEALLGREVCYKRRNQAVIGLLDAYTARHTRSKNIVEYACTIRRVDDEEDVI